MSWRMTVVGNGLAPFRLDILWKGSSPFLTKAAVVFDGDLFIEMFKQVEVVRRQPTLLPLPLVTLPIT